ncbi:MAG: L,D-transpeptidase [Actinobacteria bacterium]|nr:MAG: L,D-transpeptidase [Actinomycetota bacterium]
MAASVGAESARAHTQPGVGPSVRQAVFVAYARVPHVSVYGSEASSRVRETLTSPTDDGTLLSFLVRSLHRRRALVSLPTRPNGSSGWVSRSQVRIYRDQYRVKIDLRGHRLTVWREGSAVVRAPIGVGRAVTPTPAGTYYIVSRIRPPDPGSVYGAFAFGLSAHSNVFTRFGFGGDGRIGLHGTNDPSGVGHDVSHGCIRMTNRTILRLSRMLPLGTPVTITHT